MNAMLETVQSRRSHHVLVDDVVNGPGGERDVSGARPAQDLVADRLLGKRRIEPHGSAGEVVGVQVAE